MQPSRSRLFAAAVLALGGGLLGVTALAIVVARAVVAAGIPGVVVRAEGLGLLVWMIGLWLVAARFDVRAFRQVRAADPA